MHMDLRKVRLELCPAGEFHERFKRTNLRVYDHYGELIGKRFNYVIMANMDRARNRGSSEIYMLVLTRDNVHSFSDPDYDVVHQKLQQKGINIADIENGDYVLVGKYQGMGLINKLTLSVGFDRDRRYAHEQEQKESKSGAASR